MPAERQKPENGTVRDYSQQAPNIIEALLGVHSASNADWIADAAGSAAERGLGALYSLLFLNDAYGKLVGQRPASSERKRALLRLHQALETDFTTVKFDPQDVPAVAAALQEGGATVVPDLGDALPLQLSRKKAQAAQRSLGIEEVLLAPLHWGGQSLGLLVLLMPPGMPGSLRLAGLLGCHAAVALVKLSERDAGRRHGELDTVRWVYDERRFLEELNGEARRALRHKRPLSIMLLRLVNLHQLRSRYGRFLAEQVLRQLSHRLADSIRDTDFLGAFGDDGFACILVEADETGAERARERLLPSAQATQLPEVNLPGLQVRLATALATLAVDGQTAEELIAAAEERLAQAARTQPEEEVA